MILCCFLDRSSLPYVYDNSGKGFFDASLQKLINMVDTVRTGECHLPPGMRCFACSMKCTCLMQNSPAFRAEHANAGSGLLVDDRKPFATPPLCFGPWDSYLTTSPTKTMSFVPIFDSQACM